MLCIQQTTVLTPTERLTDHTVLIDGEQIVGLGPSGGFTPPERAQVINGAGLLLAPGFIDLQCNGAFGHDFTTDPATIWPVAAGLPLLAALHR